MTPHKLRTPVLLECLDAGTKARPGFYSGGRFTGVDPGVFNKGPEPGGLGDGRRPVGFRGKAPVRSLKTKSEIGVQYLTFAAENLGFNE